MICLCSSLVFGWEDSVVGSITVARVRVHLPASLVWHLMLGVHGAVSQNTYPGIPHNVEASGWSASYIATNLPQSECPKEQRRSCNPIHDLASEITQGHFPTIYLLQDTGYSGFWKMSRFFDKPPFWGEPNSSLQNGLYSVTHLSWIEYDQRDGVWPPRLGDKRLCSPRRLPKPAAMVCRHPALWRGPRRKEPRLPAKSHVSQPFGKWLVLVCSGCF